MIVRNPRADRFESDFTRTENPRVIGSTPILGTAKYGGSGMSRTNKIMADVLEVFQGDPRVEEIRRRREARIRQVPPSPPKGGIGIREAGRKYDVAPETICKWVRRGLIRVLLETKNVKYIDEAMLVKIVKIYQEAPGRGRWTVRRAFAS